MFQRSARIAILYLPLMALLGGCGDSGIETYPVTGLVVLQDDTPVKFGRIEFYHADHDLTASGTIQEDGTFELGTYSEADGAPAGKHAVAITQLIMLGESGITPHDHGTHIASHYSDYDSSGIELTVEASGNNSFRIVVEPR